jgi:vacuolar iron transporter family protein
VNRAEDLERYRSNLQGEIDAIALYRSMEAAERDPKLKELYGRLASVEERHANFWEEALRKAGVELPTRTPTWRTRVLTWVAGRFGPQAVLPSIAATENADQTRYDGQSEADGTSMPGDERSHARVLNLMVSSFQGGVEGSVLARLEGRHRGVGGNALRAAVLGGNDGLVSNLSLVMGVSGAQLSNHGIIVTGLAGLLAGACSMAIGEWISVQSSRELNQRQIAIEADELKSAPAEEEEELALIYQVKGIPEEQAKALAKRLIADPAKALDTLVREELGIDPRGLGGSAREAALTSFGLFAFGAIIPLLPFFFLQGQAAIWTSVGLSALGLFLVGSAITLVTGRPILVSGSRQLSMGLAAAAITYMLGRLLGVSLAG